MNILVMNHLNKPTKIQNLDLMKMIYKMNWKLLIIIKYYLKKNKILYKTWLILFIMQTFRI